jgi:small subunit ribosomal protein S1
MRALRGCRQNRVQSLFLPASQVSHGRVQSLDQIFKRGDKLKVLVLSFDREREHVTLNTKELEKIPGDMLRNPQLVYESAEEMAAMFKCVEH